MSFHDFCQENDKGKDYLEKTEIFFAHQGFPWSRDFFFYFWENMQPSHTQVLRFFPLYRQMFK